MELYRTSGSEMDRSTASMTISRDWKLDEEAAREKRSKSERGTGRITTFRFSSDDDGERVARKSSTIRSNAECKVGGRAMDCSCSILTN